jgi:hypothetical protein
MLIDCAQEQIPGVLFAHCHADEASDLIDDIGGSAGENQTWATPDVVDFIIQNGG